MSNYLFIAGDDPGPRRLGPLFHRNESHSLVPVMQECNVPITGLIPVMHGWTRAQFQALTSAGTERFPLDIRIRSKLINPKGFSEICSGRTCQRHYSQQESNLGVINSNFVLVGSVGIML
ncbi:hypothetical protein TNCT_293831 [Trichonephila clavata]|uniref:Uncharacterized protein n=1 Tax=Trichonephila clavata TaxID=2740835 RepID=A0A8X6EYK2_TRICU|nr:hypothetical protein TNCT_293831 [Trichonephila clavata]